MTNINKVRIIVVCIAIFLIIKGIVGLLDNKETQEGFKNFQIEVISEHNNFHEITNEKSDLLFLGEYLRIIEKCHGDESQFGFFVTGWAGVENDDSYFWWVTINGEDSMVGVDEIPLNDGDIYTFTHTEAGGW